MLQKENQLYSQITLFFICINPECEIKAMNKPINNIEHQLHLTNHMLTTLYQLNSKQILLKICIYAIKRIAVKFNMKIIIIFVALFLLTILFDITLYMLMGEPIHLTLFTNQFKMMSPPEYLIIFALFSFVFIRQIISFLKRSR